jgi:hypothetical protein
MGRGFNILWVRCSIYYRLGVKILSVGGHFDHLPHTNGILTTYPWYFEPCTNGILNPLPKVFWPPTQSISNHLRYIEQLTHGILITLPMGFLHTYPCYIKPLPMVFWNPSHSTSNPLPYHGNFTPVPMIYRTPYRSYIEPPTDSILTPYI